MRSNRIRLIVVLLLVVGPGSGFCMTDAAAAPQTGGGPSGRPRIRVDEATFHWGKLLRGEIVEHTFKVHNDGDATLKIKQVKPT